MEYGFKALGDYRKCKYKMPVFSLEWLLFENLSNLHKIEFDKNNHVKEVTIILISSNYTLKNYYLKR